MELEHTFTVPVPPEQAFEVLQDIERIGPCMPGASIDSVDGRSFTGKVKVKIGPIQVTYAGEAEYAEVDADALTATINARGKESRGSGTANATISAAIKGVEEGAEVHVITDLAITGRPAQFGRGVMEEVGQKLINQFAECLAGKLGGDEDDEAADTGTTPPSTEVDQAAAAGAAASAAGPSGNGSGATSATSPASTPASTSPSSSSAAEPQAIDLLDVAGGSIAKRVGPALGGLFVLYLIVRWLRRR